MGAPFGNDNAKGNHKPFKKGRNKKRKSYFEFSKTARGRAELAAMFKNPKYKVRN